MTTKDEFVPLKKQYILQNFGGKNQFSNLNLNQSQKCLYASLVQSNNKSISNSKDFGLQQHFLQSVDGKNRKSSWNKLSSNTLNPKPFKSFSAFDEAEENVKTKKWKNDSSDATTTRSSTLSLHIAAYERYIEGGDNVTWDDEKLGLKRNLINGQKQILINSALNSFEFPRQQKDDETDPAVMQFTASQQLLGPNQLGSSSNDNQQGTRNVAGVRPALIHFNQRPPHLSAQIFRTAKLTVSKMDPNRMLHPSQSQQHVFYEEYFTTSQEVVEPPPLMPIQYSQQQRATRYVNVPHLVQSNQASPPPPNIFPQQPVVPLPASKLEEPIDLVCDEDIGRCQSPEEFPEYVPGAWDEARQQKSIAPGKSAMRFRTELDSGDVKLVNELGQLTVDNLLDYMKNLQNNAFLLGEEEAKEFQRAKCLGIFQK